MTFEFTEEEVDFLIGGLDCDLNETSYAEEDEPKLEELIKKLLPGASEEVRKWKLLYNPSWRLPC